MRSNSLATVMICAATGLLLGAPAHGEIVLRSPSFEAGAGPALDIGDGSRRFHEGVSARLSAVWLAADRPEWILDAGWTRYAAKSPYGLPFLNGGRLYFPQADDPDAIRAFTVQGGLRRAVRIGPARPYVEGLAGGGFVSERLPGLRNERRADPALDFVAGDERRLAFSPSLALGAGLEFNAPARIGLSASIAAQWVPVSGTEAPLLPVRLAVVWPTKLAAEAAPARTGRTPRLIVSTGASVRLLPDLSGNASEAGVLVLIPRDSRNDWNPGASVGFGLELPLNDVFLVGVHGEQAVHSLRGGLTPRFPSTSERRDAAVTTLLATATVRARIRALRPYLRAGLGWGAGGFEPTYGIDSFANLVKIGYDVSETFAFAQSAAAGIEIRIDRHASILAEGGVVRLDRASDDTVVAPVKFGIAFD